MKKIFDQIFTHRDTFIVVTLVIIVLSVSAVR